MGYGQGGKVESKVEKGMGFGVEHGILESVAVIPGLEYCMIAGLTKLTYIREMHKQK